MAEPENTEREINMTNYYIGCSGDYAWEPASAKTLIGAKREASATVQESVGGRMMVGEGIGEGETFRIETVAVKMAHEKWRTPW